MKSGVEEYPLGPALAFLQRLASLNHALGRLSRRMEKRFGVTAQQRLILRCVGKYPGMPAGQLASLLRLDPGTVSASLNRLEARGLLERRRDPRDQRRTCLGLTAKGRVVDRPSTGTVEAGVERLLDGTDRRKLASAMRVLEQLTVLLGEEETRA